MNITWAPLNSFQALAAEYHFLCPMGKHCCLPYHFSASKLIFLPLHTEGVGASNNACPLGTKSGALPPMPLCQLKTIILSTNIGIHFCKKDITLLENVQHCTTRLTTSFGSKSHEKRLSSSETGTTGYVIQFFQIFKKMIMFMVIFGFKCLLQD